MLKNSWHIKQDNCDELTSSKVEWSQQNKRWLAAKVRNHIYVANTFRLRRKVDEPRLIVWKFKGKNINARFIKAGINLRSGNYKL